MIAAPQASSRDYYVKLYKSSVMEGLADEDFNKFASPDSEYIDSALVADDLASLREASGRLEGFADKHTTHSDIRGLIKLSTFNDVDSCIDLLNRLYVKYHSFFHAKKIDTSFTEPKHDWKNIFSVPWLPSSE